MATQHVQLVVGVDGSPAARAALDWSIRQARLLAAEVIAVHAWQPADRWRAPYAPLDALPTPEDDRKAADRLLDDVVAPARVAAPGTPLTGLLVEGPAVPVLIAYAAQAHLLVLGRRVRRDPVLPALGSTALACMRGAACPVVTVPERAPESHRSRSTAEPDLFTHVTR
ncbi:universal stress protein [Streptomyces sp. NPDC050095]|uniref:universal stress protein n=1 Tax=unclassified Streptomyces TaxID=2593676 RepID=UPI0034454060